MKKAWLVGVVLAVMAVACGDGAQESSTAQADTGAESESDAVRRSTQAPIDEPVADPDPSEGTTPRDDVAPIEVDHPNPLVAAAIGDLVARFGVDVESVEVASVEEVTWPDGSVGCPLPGMQYTQALVDGTRILLRAQGVEYQYNSGGSSEPFYCENPSDPVAGEGQLGDS